MLTNSYKLKFGKDIAVNNKEIVMLKNIVLKDIKYEKIESKKVAIKKKEQM